MKFSFSSLRLSASLLGIGVLSVLAGTALAAPFPVAPAPANPPELQNETSGNVLRSAAWNEMVAAVDYAVDTLAEVTTRLANIFTSSGKIGIGIETPEQLLHLKETNSNSAGLALEAGSRSNYWGIFADNTTEELRFWNEGGGSNGIRITPNAVLTTSGDVCVEGGNCLSSVSGGSNYWQEIDASSRSATKAAVYNESAAVGIGTNDPQADLHIAGSLYVEGGSGDIDGDGSIGSGDLTSIEAIMQGNNTSMDAVASADINGDGRVTIEDANLMATLFFATDRSEIRKRAQMMAGLYGAETPTLFKVKGSTTIEDSLSVNGVSSAQSMSTDTIAITTNAYADQYCNADGSACFRPGDPTYAVYAP